MIENYEKLDTGVIHQIKYNKFDYNIDYVSIYKTYGERENYINYLRYAYIVGSIGYIPDSLLDVGYGDGSFLKLASKTIPYCFGHDISGEKIPEGCEFLSYDEIFKKRYEIVTFFDTLEHMEDISFLHKLNTQYILVTVPNCQYSSNEWFTNWKHRKPDEHLWHFNRPALALHMLEEGYTSVNITNIEDVIRKHNEEYPNILTGLFQKM